MKKNHTKRKKFCCDFVTEPRIKVDASDELCNSWRKLCGLKYEEESIIKSKDLMGTLLTSLSNKFPNINLGWAENDYYSKNLTINGAATNLNSLDLMRAYEGLVLITDNNSAMDLLVETIVRKMKCLFS